MLAIFFWIWYSIRHSRIENTMKNPALFLRAQDVVVALKLSVARDRKFTYSQLAQELAMSASEVHAATARAINCRLIVRDAEQPRAQRTALLEFLVHGIQYVFPAYPGHLTRGVPTGVGASPLRELFAKTNAPIPIWPTPTGAQRGVALMPLYPALPKAVESDRMFYELLTLVDAIRGGAAREREMGKKLLTERLV
jgi:hypothetical protein